MTFRRLAWNNVKGNWHRYIAFFLSSTFSVMIFFIYAAFLFHPDVVNGTIRAADKVRQGMVLCEYIIILFSFFFVLYSMSAFLKSRKKELGLLSLFGMTNRQIAAMILYESTLIAVMAIAAGIGLGALFSKLFFMALAELLQVDSPIRFILAPKALLYTAVGFFALFELITLFTLRKVGRTQIIDLLKAARKPKSVPVFSKWLVLLSAVFLAGGYGLAYASRLNTIMITMLPILFLVIVGTYFLFTQTSVAVFRWIQRSPGLYYRGTNLVTVAQLVFKMKDNARTLFMVAILSAVILTASGSFYVLYQDIRNQVTDLYPQSFGLVENGTQVHRGVQTEELKSIAIQDGYELKYEVKLTGVPVPIELPRFRNSKASAMLVPESAYNEIAERVGRQTVRVEPGHATYVFPYRGLSMDFFTKGSMLDTELNGQPLQLQMDGQLNGAVINPGSALTGLLVLDDGEYAERIKAVPGDKFAVYYGFEIMNWERSQMTSQKMEEAVPKELRKGFSNRVEDYLHGRQFSALTLFIGLFVSVLFFIASGSMLYFKLFTELQEDQAQYRALSRIGVSPGEIRLITGVQIGIIFFVPVLVGVIHALFAYKSLGNMMHTSVWQYSAVVIAIYAALQFVYFALTRKSYMKQLGHGL